MARAIVDDTDSTQARFVIDQSRQAAGLTDAGAAASNAFGEFVEELQREISAAGAASNALGNLSRTWMPHASAPQLRACDDRGFRPAGAATSTGTNDKIRALESYRFYSATPSPESRDRQPRMVEPNILGVIAPASPQRVNTSHE
ncbi:hypothetical protein [Methylobacterium sp. WL120]|uniref:hypothetical protein n=1 Tax=Methylobacterium sp. WL120 TaxID=2603887 RepID=UPI0011D7FD81|nr:hypothetical protein [Methylobacterium sp. WL120]TXM67016.1 hypothetical protein FV229_11375 [Methylobacterium sp. WL120]